MSQSHETAWDIITKRLFPYGFGHALATQREVEVGDVGWLHEGDFMQLFNCMNEGDSFGFGL